MAIVESPHKYSSKLHIACNDHITNYITISKYLKIDIQEF